MMCLIKYEENSYEDFLGNFQFDLTELLPSLTFRGHRREEEGVRRWANSLVDVIVTPTAELPKSAVISIRPLVSYGREYLKDVGGLFEDFLGENYRIVVIKHEEVSYDAD